MDDLIAFVKARLDEEEAAARTAGRWLTFEAKPDDWTRLMCDPVLGPFGGQTRVRNVATGLYVGKMSDPSRALREIAVKRGVLAWYAEAVDCSEFFEAKLGTGKGMAIAAESYLNVIRAYAAVHCEHPDYRQEWAAPSRPPAQIVLAEMPETRK